jgi:hypothetical protein
MATNPKKRPRFPMPRLASHDVYAILAVGLLLAVVIGESLLYRAGMAALCVLAAAAFRYDYARHVALALIKECRRRLEALRARR